MDLNHTSITNSIQKHQNGCLQYMDRCGVGESLPEESQVVIGIPGKGLGKRPNIHATKKTNKKHCTFEAAKDSLDQGEEVINVEVGHIDNQPPHTESPPY
ncbi:hypothetical protein O181_101762 [Austropuccinia psidii MF-1]|uniref:Uncharacterized protein n=1 Tax=Austropuccinia psidii MF-1 TaxID=1389203 RepID=A0A9Q3JGM0_9BASI|nr:hypothetical protein [Austropuccinia psidii MF-1]